MQINIDLLITWGAVSKRYRKNDFVFQEDDEARFYYQIESGAVRMFNANDEGKEFTQGQFSTGNSFGEPPLFLGERYPSSAICTEESIIIKLSRDSFFKILEAYPLLQRSFIELFAQRMFNKAMTVRGIIHHSPEERIMDFLNTYKKCKAYGKEKVMIPHTRQEIANCTGLRVETVIRTLSRLNESGKVSIQNRKLYY